jgi:hypothetical protein
MTTTFESAKVGDEVFSPTFGWGVIEAIDLSSGRPIRVHFFIFGDTNYYSLKGWYTDLPIQSLFWGEVVIDAPVKPVATKVVNGVKIPDISFVPIIGEYCHIPFPTHPKLYSRMYYSSYEADEYVANNNMCYPDTEEGKIAAVLHAKAMLGISTN